MADNFTPYWGLTQPEVGASRDTWGAKLNNDLAALDTLLQALQPIGAMTDFAGWAAPVGWLMCDGTLYLIASYPRLFAVIGAAYGGDGVTTFAVPDARGRMTAGAGTSYGDLGYTLTIGVGQKLGDAEIALGQANLPNAPITTSVAPAHTHGGSVTDLQGEHDHPAYADGVGDHQHLGEGTQFNAGGMSASGGGGITINTYDKWTSWAGAHNHPIYVNGNGLHAHNLAISADGAHAHTFSLGGTNTPVRIVPPMIGATKIICCGPPSMQSVAALSPGEGTMRLMASPLRGLH